MLRATEKLKKEAQKAGFLDIGVVNAGFSYNSAKRLLIREKEGEITPFVPRDIIKRVDPKKYVFWAKSAIVVTFSNQIEKKIISKPQDGYLRGRISRSAWEPDYHKVLTDRLNLMAENLIKKNIISRYQPFVDTSPLSERELAFRAGIGTFGKNNAIISPKNGSFVFIGGLFVDVDLPCGSIDPGPGDELVKCLGCRRCIDNCPGKALGNGNRLNYEWCVSYLTVKKGFINENLRPLIGDYIYGCDKCLEVCPTNLPELKSEKYEQSEVEFSMEDVFPRLDFLLNLTKKEFNRYYGNTALSWRPKTVIQRNAVIVLGNLQDPRGLDLLLKVLKNKGELVCAHALWSIGRTYNKLSDEKKELVRKDISKLKQKRKDIWTKALEFEYDRLAGIIH